jgi:short-subunit dehydrogenase
MSSLPVVVITGASGGIGECVAYTVAATKRYRVALIARRVDELKAVTAKCGPEDTVMWVTADVTKRVEVKAAVQAIVDKFGTIDVWVNNAGRGMNKPFTEVTEDDIQDMMTVNVNSVLICTQEVLPVFKAKSQGQFINVSSLLGRNAEIAVFRSAYCGAKHFLNAMTCSLRAEHRESHPNIKFQTFTPGPVATDFGLNAKGADSRTFSNAQDPNEVAQVLLDESIEQRKEEVYSREAYKEFIGKYLASLVE